MSVTVTPKESSEGSEVNVNYQHVEQLEIEEFMNSRKDSAIRSVASIEGTQTENCSSLLDCIRDNDNMDGNSLTKLQELYCLDVENISEEAILLYCYSIFKNS